MADENHTEEPKGLTDAQTKFIKDTWSIVKDDIGLEAAGTIMFIKLFEIAPELQELFPFKGTDINEENEGMKKHGLQVMESVDMAISLLDNPEELVETLKELGIVHNMSNVQVDSFAPVGQALVYTLQTGLKEKFTKEVAEAWLGLYAAVQHYMTLGMQEGLDA